MERRYRQLSLEERCSIARLREDGQSLAQIAAALDRSASSISRELKRNCGSTVGYKPTYAQEQAKARRWSGMRLERDAALRKTVLGCLAQGWSPEQVSRRLAKEQQHHVISHESIYRFIYAQIRRTKNYDWRQYLPRAKSKRGYRRKAGGSARSIPHRIPISNRPKTVDDRSIPGHWESDLMAFASYGQVILALHERTTRFTLITRQPSKHAEPTAQQLIQWLKPLPSQMRRSVTFDNGSEFAQHYRLHEALKIQTYFCDTHSPWQKGGVENTLGRLRRFLPRKTNLDEINPDQIQAFADACNNTPRKCLDFYTPAEAFQSKLLHFKCESIFPPSRE
jgi:transposase, IS30 family